MPFHSHGGSSPHDFSWTDPDLPTLHWVQLAISVRPRVACFGFEPDSFRWSDENLKLARDFARLLAADGRNIKLEDGLRRTIEPLNHARASPSTSQRTPLVILDEAWC